MALSIFLTKAVLVALGVCGAFVSIKLREPFFAFIGGMAFATGAYFL